MNHVPGTLILLLIFTAGHCLHNENKTEPEDIKVGLGRLSANISINESGSIMSSVSGTLLDDTNTKLRYVVSCFCHGKTTGQLNSSA